MKSALYPFCLAGLLMLLSACSSDGDQPNPIYSDQQFDFNEVRLSCGTEPNCDGSVGMLMYQERSGSRWVMYRCTGSLVAQDIVATNNHCLPTAVQDFTQSSTGRLQFYFLTPSTSPGGSKLIPIHEVIYTDPAANDDAIDVRDYAYVRLSQPLAGHPVKTLNTAGIRQNQNLHATVVNHYLRNSGADSRVLNYVLDRLSCRHVSANYFNSAYFDPNIESFGVDGCRAIGGNSGSPMMNEQGEVVGLLHGSISEEGGDALAEAMRPFLEGLLGHESLVKNNAFVTNIRCTQGLPLLTTASSCVYHSQISQDEKDLAETGEAIREDLPAFIDTLNSSNSMWKDERFYLRVVENADVSSTESQEDEFYNSHLEGVDRGVLAFTPLCYYDELRRQLEQNGGSLFIREAKYTPLYKVRLTERFRFRVSLDSNTQRVEMKWRVRTQPGSEYLSLEGELVSNQKPLRIQTSSIPPCSQALIDSYLELPMQTYSEDLKRKVRELQY